MDLDLVDVLIEEQGLEFLLQFGGLEAVINHLIANGSLIPPAEPQRLLVTWTIDGEVVQTNEAASGDTLEYTGEFPHGTSVVTACVDDGIHDPVCTDMLVVFEHGGPAEIVVAPPSVMWPPNHKYRTFDLADCVVSASAECGGPIDLTAPGALRIVSISSDEPEDANGNGDGRTEDDMVIVSDTAFKLRAERRGGSAGNGRGGGGPGNGRVYTVLFEVDDGFGNTTLASCQIGVPHSQNGDSAVDDGAAAGYTVTNDTDRHAPNATGAGAGHGRHPLFDSQARPRSAPPGIVQIEL